MQYIVDAARLTDKESSHAYLKEVLDLPEYYGNNLDALNDCLTEMIDTEIVIENVENAGNYYGRIVVVMMGASHENDELMITIEEENDEGFYD